MLSNDDATQTATTPANSEPISEQQQQQQCAPPFQRLLGSLHKLLSGDSAVEVEAVLEALASYKTNKQDWAGYCHFSDERYTRHLVDDGNGLFNVMILCWSTGQESPIHDHAQSHCFVKCLDGDLREDLFPPPRDVQAGQPLECVRSTILGADGCCYIDDTIGMHRMANPSHTDPTVTLHIYCPPYQQCRLFCERTGTQSQSCKLSFYSRFGQVLPSSC